MNSLINMIIVLFYLIQLKLKRRKKCERSNVDGLNGDKGWPIKNTFAILKTRQISMLLETSKFLQTIVNHYLYNIILCIRNLWQTHPQFQERLTSSRSSRYAMLRKNLHRTILNFNSSPNCSVDPPGVPLPNSEGTLRRNGPPRSQGTPRSIVVVLKIA